MSSTVTHRPTFGQSSAADPAASAWVTASAGAGKTRVLTDRVLRLLLAGTPPGKILCLTFTKASAAEMRLRVTDRLGAWAVMDDKILGLDLQTLTMASKPDGELMAKARGLFAAVLDVPGGIKIQTIHGFCESLLARFPLEIELTSHFRVAEEAQANEFLATARDQVLRNVREDPARAKALTELTGRVNEGQFGDVMKRLAGDRARLDRLLNDDLETINARTRKLLGLSPGETSQSIARKASADGAFDRPGLAAAVQSLAKGTKTDIKRGDTIARWLETDDGGRANLFRDFRSVFLTGTGTIQKVLATKAVKEVAPDLAAVMEDEAQRILMTDQRMRAADVASGTAALLAIGSDLHRRYAQEKARHGALDFDDLILLSAALLREPNIGPWVLYKLDGGIDHILIDEAQDTSPEQWDLITAIAREFFSGIGAQDSDRTVFAVGDAKQSIYAFRQADPGAFAQQRENFEAQVLAAGKGWRPTELADSFRSTAPILNAVDAIFSQDAAKPGMLIAESEVRHNVTRTGQAGSVELWPVEPPHVDDDADAWVPPRDQHHSSSASAKLADRIATTVHEWIGSETLPARNRNVKAGDVLILVRRRTTQFVQELSRALKVLGVPVAGSDRMVLSEQLPVMDLVALGRFALLPEDDLNLAVVLKGPFVGLNEQALFDLAYDRENTLWGAMRVAAKTEDNFAQVSEFLSGILARADTMPPYQFFAEFLAGGGRRQIVQRLGSEANDSIDELLAGALEFERTHAASLQGFLHWLDNADTDIKRDLEAARDEVRIMTIHGAKGLQAPIVILPDTCSVPKNLDPVLWNDDGMSVVLRPSRNTADVHSKALMEAADQRQMEEYNRLLYVALTRAEDRLVVCGWDTKIGRKDSCWYNLIEGGLETLADGEDLPGEVRRWSQAQTADPDMDRGDDVSKEIAAPVPDWLGTSLAPVEPDPPRLLAPSRPDGEEPPALSPLSGIGAGAGLRRGVLIHRMLQLLADVSDDRRDEAAAKFIAGSGGAGFDTAALQEMVETTLAVLRDDEFSDVFGPGSRSEVSVTGSVGGAVISGEIDRLVVTDHAILIVDFKTHRPAPVDNADVPGIYLRQMAAYRGAILDIYPGKLVCCALLWTDGPRLMPLTDQAMDAAAP